MGYPRFCWQSPTARSSWGRGVPTSQVGSVGGPGRSHLPPIRAVGCRGSCCTAAGCVWGCWGLAQVWLSGTKMPLFCEVIAQRTFRSRELGLAHLLDGKSYWAFLGSSCIQKDCCKGGKARRYKKNSKAEKSISQ